MLSSMQTPTGTVRGKPRTPGMRGKPRSGIGSVQADETVGQAAVSIP